MALLSSVSGRWLGGSSFGRQAANGGEAADQYQGHEDFSISFSPPIRRRVFAHIHHHTQPSNEINRKVLTEHHLL
jgi:hypothetical protein